MRIEASGVGLAGGQDGQDQFVSSKRSEEVNGESWAGFEPVSRKRSPRERTFCIDLML